MRDPRVVDENNYLKILCVDEPGAGGACHVYRLEYDPNNNGYIQAQTVSFQNGPIQEKGVNGVQNEDLLTIVADRLESFQKGAFSCRENALALTKIQEALHWLQHRTDKRKDRGVEGMSII